MQISIDLLGGKNEWERFLNMLVRYYATSHNISGIDLPYLYDSNIKYKRETGEHWQSPIETARLRSGDCEDLALYRATELCRNGIDAHVRIYRTHSGGYHAIVDICGVLEDPSALRGMNSHMGEDAPSQINDPTLLAVSLLPVDPATKMLLMRSAPLAKRAIKRFKLWKKAKKRKAQLKKMELQNEQYE